MAKGSGGGGYGSRPHVEKPVKTGTGSRSTNPGGVGQLGQSQGSHVTRGEESSYRGDPLHSGPSFQPTEFGNAIAARTVCKPGGSREVKKSGSQQQYGSGGPEKPSGRDILGDFGPESSRPHNPRHNPGRSSDTDADF
jgi:hypothetical protein